MSSPAANRGRRIVIAAVALVAVLALPFVLLRGPASDEGKIRARATAFIDDVERLDADAVASYFFEAAELSIDGEVIGSNREEIRQLAAESFRAMASLRLRGEFINVAVQNDIAKVDYSYHWSASSQLYPNMRSKSESLTEDEKPMNARIHLRRFDDKWMIAYLEAETTPR